jgi:hypothetical protein
MLIKKFQSVKTGGAARPMNAPTTLITNPTICVMPIMDTGRPKNKNHQKPVLSSAAAAIKPPATDQINR